MGAATWTVFVAMLLVACAPVLEETDARIASKLVDRGIAVLDVRTPQEFAPEHLEGAMNIDYSSPDFRERIASLDRRQPYLVYCGSGKRSHNATRVMAEMGFREVYDLAGGIAAWKAAGLPVVCTASCPPQG